MQLLLERSKKGIFSFSLNAAILLLKSKTKFGHIMCKKSHICK